MIKHVEYDEINFEDLNINAIKKKYENFLLKIEELINDMWINKANEVPTTNIDVTGIQTLGNYFLGFESLLTDKQTIKLINIYLNDLCYNLEFVEKNDFNSSLVIIKIIKD